jgi:hypothetical protein
MGSMLKADSERQELVRERRQARIERKQQRRDARERKRARISGAPPAPVADAARRPGTGRHGGRPDRDRGAGAPRPEHRPGSAAPATRTFDERPAGEQRTEPARPPAGSQTPNANAQQRVVMEAAPVAADGERRSHRERDIAAFRERRRQAADEARAEARERIARAGELASVAEALAALAHPGAGPWESERQELDRALQDGRVVEVGAVARRLLWAISRDAARSSRRARRDPDLALAVCVAYAIIARLPRSAVRSAHRTHPEAPARAVGHRAFWR